MRSRTANTLFKEIPAHVREWTLRWLKTITSELGMTMSCWTDRLQIKLDAEQEERHD